jgi:DinB superfamily
LSGAQVYWRFMNRNSYRLILCGLLSAAALLAEDNPFSSDARQQYALVKDNLMKAAGRMPEENYSFRSVPQVRTFGEMIAHVADGQLLMCQVVTGEKTTANAKFPPPKTSKADLVAALKASFDYCDPVYAKMTDAAAAAKVKWFRWDMSKLGLLNWNIAHDNEMYGIIGAFLRRVSQSQGAGAAVERPDAVGGSARSYYNRAQRPPTGLCAHTKAAHLRGWLKGSRALAAVGDWRGWHIGVGLAKV